MNPTPWTEAATAGPMHDLIVVIVPHGAADVAAALERRLRGREGLGGPVRVLGLDEPPDARLGNLGGTLRAWRWLQREVPGLSREVARGRRVLMLHDAGAATRSSPWSLALRGRRGDLPLPADAPMDLRQAVALQMAPLAPSGHGVVDVAWTSQLVLPGVEPAALPSPTADLTKLVATWTGGLPSVDAARELGWFRLDPLGFAPGGSFADLTAWAAWGARAADVGSFRATPDLLDRLLTAGLPLPVDLDPGLTGPALAGRAAAPVSVGVLPVDPLAWWRLRRPAEVLRFLRAFASDGRESGALRSLVGLSAPLVRCSVGGAPVTATWAEVRAGLRLGEVWICDAALVDVDLAPGSSITGSMVMGARGLCRLVDSAALGGGPLDATGALLLGVEGAAVDEVAVRVPDGRVVRLGMEVDPRAVDELVVGSNGASFATLRSSLPR